MSTIKDSVLSENIDDTDEYIDIEAAANEKPDDHPIMQQVSGNWRFGIVIAAYVNRCILEKINLNKNFIVVDKKIETVTGVADPININDNNLDPFSVNVFRHIHHGFSADLKYLKNKYGENKIVKYPKVDELSPTVKDMLNKLVIGLVTLNEQTMNFISSSHESLYDPKIRKTTEYFIRQREYILAIGGVKMKYGDEEGRTYEQLKASYIPN